jgi:DNA repair exonuclease SbcCD ATPase subunit
MLKGNEIQQAIQRLEIRYQSACDKYSEEKTSLLLVEDRLECLKQAQSLAQEAAQKLQQRVHSQIAGIVSHCLQLVFDEPYVFNIVFERKRGRTEARLVFERNGLEVDPMTASGGGVIDVAAFALRLSSMLLNNPRLRKLMIMDEPFKFVSQANGYRERVRDMLINLSERFGVQFIMVTHMPELQAGKVVCL